jgi:hypothetical protein
VHKADHHAWVANAPPGKSGDGRLALAAALSAAKGQQGALIRSGAAAAVVAPPPAYACGLNAYDIQEYAAAAGFRSWFWTSIHDGPQLLPQAAPSPQGGGTAAAASGGFKGFISSPLAGGSSGGGGSARLASSRSAVGLGFGRDSASSAGSGAGPSAGPAGPASGSPSGGGLQRTASMRAGSTAAGLDAGGGDGGAGGFVAGFGTGTAASSGAFSGAGAAASTSASLTRLLVELVDDMLEYWGFVEAQGGAGLPPALSADALPWATVAGGASSSPSPATGPGGPPPSSRHSGADARDDRLLARSTGEDRGRHHAGKPDDRSGGGRLGIRSPAGPRVPWVAASVAASMPAMPASSPAHVAAGLIPSARGAPQSHTRF